MEGVVLFISETRPSFSHGPFASIAYRSDTFLEGLEALSQRVYV